MSTKTTLEQIASNKSFGGTQERWRHWSETTQCEMTFSIYLPPQAKVQHAPCVYWLSGLTCTDENFVQKAGAQQFAAELGLIIVAPDTSPRGDGVPDDENGSWDFGLGAGFYVNATQEPWAKNYQMYRYVSEELPALIKAHFPVTDKAAISGHSMGGHGALVTALKNSGNYTSATAFSPIVNPIACPWGKKALGNYLGSDESAWAEYDTCTLIQQHGVTLPLLVDQGTEDNFLAEQLLTDNLIDVLKGQPGEHSVRYQKGYDHSYFFIATFIGEHLAFHAKHLF